MSRMTDKLEVIPYSQESFKKILVTYAHIELEILENKRHLLYYFNYFDNIKVKTVVIEPDYIDHDYMSDYSSYYVRCFRPYVRNCARLHFFKSDFKKNDIMGLLVNHNTTLTVAKLNDDYLGFMVLKRLPNTIFGRTCLKTYDEDSGRRVFPLRRDYEANLFGIPLTIKRTIAFQEQDRIVAACATSALWSVFQCTGKLFQHAIPTPVEITKAATERTYVQERIIPNKGLTLEQMVQAVRYVGLEPEVVPITDLLLLKGLVYSYLKADIPLVMCMAIYDKEEYEKSKNKDKLIPRDLHAVAVTGFSLTQQTNRLRELNSVKLKSAAIDKLYVHDDQLGPFARMEFLRKALKITWKNDQGENISIIAVPQHLIVPVYHKIRVPFSVIFEKSKLLHATLHGLISPINNPAILDYLYWDLYLITIKEFKEYIFNNKIIANELRLQILLKPLPKYVWLVSLYYKKEALIELIYDTTDIEHGDCFCGKIIYSEDLASAIARKMKHEIIKYITPSGVRRTLEKSNDWNE